MPTLHLMGAGFFCLAGCDIFKYMVKNNHKGKLIVLEGLDGSGKSTQCKLLIKGLKKEGYKVETIDFPRHGEKPAWLVDEYLRGRYGTAKEVGPYRASIFYALDRYDAGSQIRKWLKEGKIVIADRYSASNIGHQGGKIKNRKERKRYFDWLYNLEYEILNIPKPDYNFILKTSPEFSLRLANKITDKEKQARRRVYLDKSEKKDIHEKDKKHLQEALRSYLHAAREFPEDFKIIECLEKGKLLSPETIHQKIWKIIKNIL
ncbi:MAG: thymidylate kinase [Candidatus Nealsonbacteria bacterium]|nr:thymidylate kinase [Candidatus Nealsonbacteria bacterium]